MGNLFVYVPEFVWYILQTSENTEITSVVCRFVITGANY